MDHGRVYDLDGLLLIFHWITATHPSEGDASSGPRHRRLLVSFPVS